MPHRTDCAVIGGGVAGLYAAWRLTSAAASGQNARPAVALFEQRSRLGGRIDTVPVARSTARVEMGAMRFWKAQQLLSSLLDQLQVPIEEFPCAAEIACYVRGVQLRSAHFSQPGNVPFRLRGAEIGNTAEALLGYALLQLAPELAALFNPELPPLTPARMDALAARPDLHHLGFWNALQTVLSSEAYQLLQVGMGERSAFSNWHAGEAVRLMAFIMRAGPTMYRPVAGFSSLTDALANAVRSTGAQVATQRRLLTLEPASGRDAGRLALTFEMLPGGERQQWIARRVILALPQRALRELLLRSHASLGELKTVEPLLDAVGVFSAFKLYASYAEPWWTRGWAPHGYTVTDLPIRQVYYGSGVGGTATDNDRVLMMIYADEAPALFWGPLLAGPQRGRGTVTHASSTSVAAPIIDEAMAQVAELHGLRDLPRPEWWACHNWGADGGAWHAWQPGVSVPETMTQIRHPFADLPLFVCGEAFSRMQGWIEGALTNTEKMLQGPPFDLPAPRWVPADYDLGP